jgi:hypothetical protein
MCKSCRAEGKNCAYGQTALSNGSENAQKQPPQAVSSTLRD